MKNVLLALFVAGIAGLTAFAFFVRAVRKRMKRYTGARSASLDWWMGELLRKGVDRSALLIQDRDQTRSIQIEKYVEGSAAELVWVFPQTGWSLPYLDRFVEEVRASGWEVSTRAARPRRHVCLEVRMGHDVQKARKLILRVLTSVYDVAPLDCRVTLLNVPAAERARCRRAHVFSQRAERPGVEQVGAAARPADHRVRRRPELPPVQLDERRCGAARRPASMPQPVRRKFSERGCNPAQASTFLARVLSMS